MSSSKHYFPHFAGLLADITEQHGADLELLSRGWVKRLHHRGRTAYIWGYHWDLNPAAAQSICADKFATHEVLSREGIRHIPHALFMRPARDQRQAFDAELDDYLGANGFPLVLKPVRGFGGDEVYFLDNPTNLRPLMDELFQRHEALALSPYRESPEEIRAVVLDGEILLCFAKQRPTVMGNGQDPLSTLIPAQLPSWYEQFSEDFLRYQHPAGSAMIPQQGQRVVVDFRHNLAQGATPRVLEREQQPAELANLVDAAVGALQLRFCSVDCLVPEQGELTIMEINAGVIIERFIDLHPQGRQLAQQVYARAFRALFTIS